jgi:hypothetical protein
VRVASPSLAYNGWHGEGGSVRDTTVSAGSTRDIRDSSSIVGHDYEEGDDVGHLRGLEDEEYDILELLCLPRNIPTTLVRVLLAS